MRDVALQNIVHLVHLEKRKYKGGGVYKNAAQFLTACSCIAVSLCCAAAHEKGAQQREAQVASVSGSKQHMKHKGHEVSRQQRRRPPLSLPARVGGAAAMLAAAWSLPHRCCHALRVSSTAATAMSGAGCQYRGYVGTAAQRASRTTASLSGGFVPGGAGRRRVNVGAAAAAAFSGSPSFSSSSASSDGRGFVVRNALGRQHRQQQQQRARVGAMRMVSGGGSDESKFFTDPDAPEEVEGVGPPGPLVGGDQVRTTAVNSLFALCACSLVWAWPHQLRAVESQATTTASVAAVTVQHNWRHRL